MNTEHSRLEIKQDLLRASEFIHDSMELYDIIPLTLKEKRWHCGIADLIPLFWSHKKQNEVCRTTDFFLRFPKKTIRNFIFKYLKITLLDFSFKTTVYCFLYEKKNSKFYCKTSDNHVRNSNCRDELVWQV